MELRDIQNNIGWRIDNNASYNYHLQISSFNGTSPTLAMDIDTAGFVGIGNVANSSYRMEVTGDMNVVGDIYAPSTKPFTIDHPNPAMTNTHKLRHSSLEAPTRGDLLYRWTLTTTNKTCHQSLPSYSPYLNENWQFLVRSTNSFGRGYVTLSPDETVFTLTTNENGTYSVLGIATRKDRGALTFDEQGTEPVK